jgi:hypothetical protein
MSDQIPPILKFIFEESRRPRSEQEQEAWRRFVQGQSTIGQLVTELDKAK